MKALLALAAFTLVSCSVSQPRWYEADSSSQRTDLDWGITVLLLDPMTTDASTVDDLHAQGKRAVCRVTGDDPETILQLCSDKGFDAVSFARQPVAEQLHKHAEKLRLPVLTAPSGT